MIWFLRLFFALVLGSMLAVTTWAGLRSSIFAIPAVVTSHPWFIATLFDTYWAFFTFYLWLAYKESCWISSTLWLVAVVLLGNIAMSIYCLIQLFRIAPNATVESVLVRASDSRPVPWWTSVALLTASAGIVFFA